jgi:hypothetical protein
MLKKNRFFILIPLLVMVQALAGCTGGTSGITVSAKTSQPVETIPVGTDTYTLTPIATATSTVTPTATKVPDLEIINSRFVDADKIIIGKYFLGQIQNNTDVIMVLPATQYSFIFNFEEFNSYGDNFLHYTFGPLGLKPGIFSKDVPQSNCVLYPHEKGVIFFQRGYLDEMEGYSSKEEELTKYSGNLGIIYSYTSSYQSNPDLSTKLHPKAENIKFHAADGNIYFEYDINVPAPKDYATEHGFVMGFLTMYDQDGKILNILYDDIINFLPREKPFDNTVHMQGQSPRGDVPVNWNWFVPITEEQLREVDHIELLFETQYQGICFERSDT